MKPWTVFLLVGAVITVAYIFTVMGPVNPFAAIGAACYVALAAATILERDKVK